MESPDFWNITLQAVLWLVYFSLHSWLAALQTKSWMASRFPQGMSYYRLAYNIFATLSLLPILWLTYRYPGPTLWTWEFPWGFLSEGLALAALSGFFLSLKYYDMREFLGLRQWQSPFSQPDSQGTSSFRISPFHRHVRHPWYSFGLILLWTRDMITATFIASVATTLYLFIGARLEENKLIAQYGEVYRRYMKRVPGLIPLPWKSISAQEASELIRQQRK